MFCLFIVQLICNTSLINRKWDHIAKEENHTNLKLKLQVFVCFCFKINLLGSAIELEMSYLCMHVHWLLFDLKEKWKLLVLGYNHQCLHFQHPITMIAYHSQQEQYNIASIILSRSCTTYTPLLVYNLFYVDFVVTRIMSFTGNSAWLFWF